MKNERTLFHSPFFFFLFFFIANNLSAQYKFQRSFEKLNILNGTQTADGGYVATGGVAGIGAGNDDIFLLKLNPFGKQEWLKTYGGTSKEQGGMVRQTNDGGYIIVGTSWSFGLPVDVYLIKTDLNGDTLWTGAYGANNAEFVYSVYQTSDSGFILCGHTNISPNNDDVYLLKTDASGNLQWTKTYGGPLSEQSYYVIQTSDGGYALTGFTNSFGVPGEGNVFLIKTNSSGDTLWTKTYGGNDEDDGQVVLQTSDGGYMIGAMSFSFGAVDFDYYLIKTDANGDTLWTKTYGGNLEDDLLSINQTSDGGYIVTGCSWIFTGSTGNFDNNTLRLNSIGDTIWTRSFGMPGYSDGGAFAQQTEDGGCIIFNWGGSGSGNSGLSHLIKTDADGNTKCPNSYIPFNIGNPPTQVIGSNWTIGSIGTGKRIPTIVNDTLVADSLFCEQCGTNNISFDATLCKGEKDTILVTSAVNSSYVWDPSDFLTCTDCLNPFASPDSSIFYFLTATDDNGCISYDSIFIKVDSCINDLFIPNFFSPDGNGMNDQWVIKGLGNYGWELQIFNRWGELMYKTDKPAEKYWDGRTFSGVQLNSGVFYYILNNNELDISRKGFFHLLR